MRRRGGKRLYCAAWRRAEARSARAGAADFCCSGCVHFVQAVPGLPGEEDAGFPRCAAEARSLVLPGDAACREFRPAGPQGEGGAA